MRMLWHVAEYRGEVGMNDQMQEHREEINPKMHSVEKWIIGALVIIVVVAVLALLGIHP